MLRRNSPYNLLHALMVVTTKVLPLMASSSSFLPLSLLSYLAFFVPAIADPIAMTWSDSTFGPDGPWPAVEVVIGNQQRIAMYPGREFQTFLLTSDYCDSNRSISCDATRAGLYNVEESELSQSGSDGFIQYQPGPDFMLGLKVSGEDATSWVDNIDLGGTIVPNVSMALLGKSFMEYPDGSYYPLTAGCLGLGAPKTVNQSFSNHLGPAYNASLIPGWLWSQDTLSSNSFGMHIGSASPKMDGSLYFGGYDKNRVVGDILTGSEDYTKEITLKDISINVVDGASPWSYPSKGGLLASGNRSITSGGLDVSVDGCTPYMSLPKSTCDALAAELPLTYNEDLGLYFWKKDDPKYSQIVNSASALEFTFLGGSNTQNVSISVPFCHLNLTIEPPLVPEKRQYFPCYTGSDKYVLGRAFLQDAFVGANWGSSTWWLAQAPGPNIPTSSVVEIADGDTTIQKSTNDWKESWSGSWKALTPEEVSGSESIAAPSATNTNENGTATPVPAGLSSGAKAGIGVGASLGASTLR